jgi:hypothetical protein
MPLPERRVTAVIQAIIESLPIAIGTVIATLPLLAVPLILLTRRDMSVLGAFMAGYAAGFLVLGGAVIAMADLFAPNPDGPLGWIVWARLLLGLGLVVLAMRKWQGRKGSDEVIAPPAWMQGIDTMNAVSALGLGFILVVLNPKNAVLVASGALAIAAATQVVPAQIGALVVFTAISGIGVATPWIMFMVLGERAIGPLDRLKTLMAKHNTAIMSAVLLVLGLVVMANAINDLL